MPSDITPDPTTLRPSPGVGWPWSAYSRNVSLAINDRTLTVTDEAGQPHYLPLGNEPGQVLELASWDVVFAPGTAAQRRTRCLVAIDVDNQPLLAVMPPDRWPNASMWAQVHGVDPITREDLGPLLATPATLIVGRPRRNLWMWAAAWYVASGFWLFSPAFWDVPRLAVFLPFLGPLALLVLIGTPRTRKARRTEEAQQAAWEPLIPDEPPPWLTRPREPRAAKASFRRRAEIVLRPNKTTVVRNDSYNRNVSLAVDGRTLIVTDETGQPHYRQLGDRPGQIRNLDSCAWTTEQGPDRARRKDNYLVGVDVNQTAVFAIVAQDRWDPTELRDWVDIHNIRLSRSREMEPGEAAEHLPHVGPHTLVIGNHRRTMTHWLWMVAWWTLGILWLVVIIAINNTATDPDAAISAWVAAAPLLASAVPTYFLIRRESRGDRERDRRLTAWHVLDSHRR